MSTLQKIFDTYKMIESLTEDLKELFEQLDKENKVDFERSMEDSKEYIQLEWMDDEVF